MTTLYQDYPMVVGGGGYASTTSAWPAVQQLSTHTSTSFRYFGYLKSGSTMYNMQTQLYCDFSTELPTGAIPVDVDVHLNVTMSANSNAHYCYICYDVWGAPSGWTTADMETASNLDNYANRCWGYFNTSWTSGVKRFYSSASSVSDFTSRVGTATEWEVTVTSQHLNSYNSTDPGTFSNYGKVLSSGNFVRVWYDLPHDHAMMNGCNL